MAKDGILDLIRGSSRNQESTQYLIEGEEIVQAGIKVHSVVKCESLLSISKSMIISVLGKLSQNGMQQIDRCLKDALGLCPNKAF